MTRKGPLTDYERGRILKLKREGRTPQEIAEAVGRSLSTVHRVAVDANLPFDNAGGSVNKGVKTGPRPDWVKEKIRQSLARKKQENA